MLLILMYHRVHGVGVSTDAFRQHMKLIHDYYPVVLPGEPLPSGEISVCLTFDDATADFCHEVFPLLEELDSKALVAVPSGYIETTTDTPVEQRLAAQRIAAMSGSYAVEESPLCTWEELRTLQDSGRVVCASHSHTHACMVDAQTDVNSELRLSRDTMEDHLGAAPDAFVYPYGRSNRRVQKTVAENYRYAMRIGTAMNLGWSNLLYRVDAEAFWPQGKVWSQRDALKYRLKYLGNRLRGR